MHPVLKNILDRKDKSVPIDDGRKISLVVFGGLMSGVTSAGGLKALQEMGLGKAFDEIYVISAGFPNACYFLAEDGRSEGSAGMSIYYEDLVSGNFINFRRPWKMVDIDYLVKIMKGVKRLDVSAIFKSSSKLFVGLWNINKKEVEYMDVKKLSPDTLHEVLRASMSIPFFNPGSVKINGQKYKDIPLLRRSVKEINYRHVLQPLKSGPTDVLAITNYSDQLIKERLPAEVCVISPSEEWELGKFETNKKSLMLAAQRMGILTKERFGFKGPILFKETVSTSKGEIRALEARL